MKDPFIKTTFTNDSIEDATAGLEEIIHYDLPRAGWSATEKEVTEDIINKLEYLAKHLREINDGKE